MSDRVIRLPAFSENGESLSGAMPLSAMERLCRPLAAAPGGALEYRLQGGRDAAGCLFLTVSLSAALPLVCRRCLEVFEFPLSARQRFWLPGGAPPADSSGEMLETGDLSLAEFLTDELLLSLPAAPAHPAACPADAFFN